MKTRLMVCAFLRHGDNMLLIHRGMHKTIAPGMWSGVGGHMENEELNNPLTACLREIAEEVGIEDSTVHSLRLRYIAIRNTGTEITQTYHFFGELSHKVPLPRCNEGTLHWKTLNGIATLDMSFSVKQIVLHWLENQEEKSVFLCGVNHDNCAATWVKL